MALHLFQAVREASRQLLSALHRVDASLSSAALVGIARPALRSELFTELSSIAPFPHSDADATHAQVAPTAATEVVAATVEPEIKAPVRTAPVKSSIAEMRRQQRAKVPSVAVAQAPLLASPLPVAHSPSPVKSAAVAFPPIPVTAAVSPPPRISAKLEIRGAIAAARVLAEPAQEPTHEANETSAAELSSAVFSSSGVWNGDVSLPTSLQTSVCAPVQEIDDSLASTMPLGQSHIHHALPIASSSSSSSPLRALDMGESSFVSDAMSVSTHSQHDGAVAPFSSPATSMLHKNESQPNESQFGVFQTRHEHEHESAGVGLLSLQTPTAAQTHAFELTPMNYQLRIASSFLAHFPPSFSSIDFFAFGCLVSSFSFFLLFYVDTL